MIEGFRSEPKICLGRCGCQDGCATVVLGIRNAQIDEAPNGELLPTIEMNPDNLDELICHLIDLAEQLEAEALAEGGEGAE